MRTNKLTHYTTRLLATIATVWAIHQAEGATVIRNARVFDGDALIETASVLIHDGRIAAIAADLATVPTGATEVDATGMTLLPGLIDCHTFKTGDESPRGRRRT